MSNGQKGWLSHIRSTDKGHLIQCTELRQDRNQSSILSPASGRSGKGKLPTASRRPKGWHRARWRMKPSKIFPNSKNESEGSRHFCLILQSAFTLQLPDHFLTTVGSCGWFSALCTAIAIRPRASPHPNKTTVSAHQWTALRCPLLPSSAAPHIGSLWNFSSFVLELFACCDSFDIVLISIS